MSRDLRRALGSNIKRIRALNGLSQEQFADRTGIHRTYVGGIERGERNVTLQTLERIADAFGLDPTALLEEEA